MFLKGRFQRRSQKPKTLNSTEVKKKIIQHFLIINLN